MARREYIEVEARFVDNLSAGAKKAAHVIEDLGNEAKDTQKKLNNMGKRKPIFDADNSRFLKKLRDMEAKANALGRKKTSMVLEAVDKATNVIGRVLNKVQGFSGKVWQSILKVKDSNASEVLSKVAELARGIAGKTWSAVVKVTDMATAPLRKLKDTLFSIKGLMAAVVTGFAAQKLVGAPIALADAYSGAKIGFSTLMGEAEGQAMMDKIDQFAKETPFKTSGVISNVQKMMAYGWDPERIIQDMETIGDAAAATGKGDEGLESIVYALSEIRSKGKLSTQELNQLASAGIKAKAYLAEGLGYGTSDEGMSKLAKDLESGAIGANQAIDLILQGMKEFEGMMDQTANETVTGLMSQIEDTFEINILRKWGQGLQDGAKKGLGSIVKLLDTADEALKDFGDLVYEVGKNISNWAADKLEKAVATIQKVVATDEFKNASLGGKISILWDEVIAKPFSEWWSSTGKPFMEKKMEEFGESLGRGISNGLLVMLGIDPEGALTDGTDIGSSFAEGFVSGFDGEAVGNALWEAVKRGLSDGGAGLADMLLPGDQGASGGQKLIGLGLGYAGMKYGLPLARGGFKLGKGVYNTGQVLTGAKGLGDVGTGAGLFARLIGNPGSAMVGGSGIMGKLAGLGYLLKGGAAGSAMSGGAAAALGGGGLFGGLFGALGIGSGIKDIWQGTKTSGKDAKNKYFSGGSKLGMVGAGAAAGGLVGGPLGALIGAGIGGAGALLGGTKFGEWLSDLTDEGGALSNLKNSVTEFFTATLPEAWNGFWDGVSTFFTETVPGAWETLTEKVSTFFTETIPEKWNEFWDPVANFFTETIPGAWEALTEKVTTFFTETIPTLWDEFWTGVGNFFLEDIPYFAGYLFGLAEVFFTETLPEAWNGLWESVTTFFTETVPEWADSIWNGHIVPFFTESIPTFFGDLWETVSTFFTETVPEWASSIWEDKVVPFFTETIPGFFGWLWDTVSTFFTETIPEWANSIWSEKIVPFFTETVPGFFAWLWSEISTFFTETIPEWASNIWSNNVVPFFTETIPGFFSSLWSGVTGFFTETLPDIASNIWSSISTFFNETLPGWVDSVWESVKGWFNDKWEGIKGNFSEGRKAAGGGDGEYRGGIVGGSSSMGAFARGGLIPGYSDGGMVRGGARLIKVAEEGSPEMIIPLSSQRRDRGLKLWAKAGEMLGAFARGGRTDRNEEGLSFRRFGESDQGGGQAVMVEMGGVHVEINVHTSDPGNIVEVIKEKAGEIADAVAGIMADELGAQFENIPARGGA